MVSFYRYVALIVFLSLHSESGAQQAANYDEAKAGSYQLPPLLKTADGKIIATKNDWETLQRPWILKQFTEQVYGRIPGQPSNMRFRTIAMHPGALQGKATRKEVTLYFTTDPAGPALHLLLYLPNNVKGKVPVFIGLNFQGNHSVNIDPAIRITDHWKQMHPSETDPKRGSQESRWPVELLLDNGYAVATA